MREGHSLGAGGNGGGRAPSAADLSDDNGCSRWSTANDPFQVKLVESPGERYRNWTDLVHVYHSARGPGAVRNSQVAHDQAFFGCRGVLIAGLILAANPAFAETKSLTLPEAVDLALKGNSALKIARFKVDEKGKKVASTSAD